jgi:hypothetical protein
MKPKKTGQPAEKNLVTGRECTYIHTYKLLCDELTSQQLGFVPKRRKVREKTDE